MKKVIFLSLLTVLVISAAQAQLKQQVDKSKVKKVETPKELKPVPATQEAPPAPPPPPAVNKTATTEEVPIYALTSVRVKVKTGNDNKEFPSKVHARLMARSTPANWRNYLQINLNNEMKINSETEFGLALEGPPTPLTTFQTAGLEFNISYEPNFFADAWKIEGLTLILEFKDQKGNLHPTLGYKTIVFSNAYGFLNGEFRNMKCVTDASFAPLTANIFKY
jgi:hypothetical protein